MLINFVLIVIIIITGSILINYNRFIKLNNKVEERKSQIDVLLNQRFDLLPNLVETVKGYAKHEKTTFEELTKLRSIHDKDGFSIEQTEKINKGFSKLIAVAENYPDLKANAQFMSLQASLQDIENRLNYARLDYNSSVTKYNNLVQTIPSNIIAKIFLFKEKELFKLEEEKKENIKVEL